WQLELGVEVSALYSASGIVADEGIEPHPIHNMFSRTGSELKASLKGFKDVATGSAIIVTTPSFIHCNCSPLPSTTFNI
ncbi:hypothetical protein FRX31_018799, partial [Thalictrum thalictroides]